MCSLKTQTKVRVRLTLLHVQVQTVLWVGLFRFLWLIWVFQNPRIPFMPETLQDDLRVRTHFLFMPQVGISTSSMVSFLDEILKDGLNIIFLHHDPLLNMLNFGFRLRLRYLHIFHARYTKCSSESVPDSATRWIQHIVYRSSSFKKSLKIPKGQ